MTRRAKIQIAAAIFCSFFAIGVMTSLSLKDMPAPWLIFVSGAFWGLFTVTSFVAEVTNRKKLFYFVLLMFTVFVFLHLNVSDRMVEDEILFWFMISKVAILMGVVGSYLLFLTFINGEGTRTLKLQTEMKLAREIHDVLAPPISRKNDTTEVEGVSRPILEVGGDMLDMIASEKGDSFIVADVSGHGVSACMVMGSCKSALRTLMQTDTPVETMMGQVNRVLLGLKKKTMFVTAALLQIKPGGDVEYCIAGHLPILHYKKETNTIHQLWKRQAALGIREKYEYRSQQTKAQKGDLFVILTDGLQEVMDAKENELGLKSIEHAVLENAHRPLKEIMENLFALAKNHGKAHDDQTLLLIRCLS